MNIKIGKFQIFSDEIKPLFHFQRWKGEISYILRWDLKIGRLTIRKWVEKVPVEPGLKKNQKRPG